MKRLFLCCLSSLAIFNSSAQNNDLIAHEWGTFTTLCGTDGAPLSNLFRDEESLPGFVHNLHFSYVTDQDKGWTEDTYLDNATVKMETPVIYFYTQHEQDFKVTVQFKHGTISQYYPNKTHGEPEGTGYQWTNDYPRSLDLSTYIGNATWEGTILSPQTNLSYSNDPSLETHTWNAPRATHSNLIRGKEDGAIEKFIFYRGIGSFNTPMHLKFTDLHHLQVKNEGNQRIPYAFVYCNEEGKVPEIWWEGELPAGTANIVERKAKHKDTSLLFRHFVNALVEAGLYADEAEAMLETWRRSYFQTTGVKVFWIVPRAFTDQILPIDMSPVPQDLERVMVGRGEILTPEFEHDLFYRREETLKKFASNHFDRSTWDRYYAAYLERANALQATGVVNVPLETAQQVVLTPNPASNEVIVSVRKALEENIDFFLYDMKGVLLEQFSIGASKGPVSNYPLSLISRAPGTYILKYTDGKTTRQEKLLVY